MSSAKDRSKLGVALFSGFVVTAAAASVHLATIPYERSLTLHVIVGDFIAGLTAVIVCLAIQLRLEEIHYSTAMDRAAIVSELNHHVRNAVFPLCLAVQKIGDESAIKLANDAVDRINLALKDATADALSGRTIYSPEGAAR